MVSPPQSRSTVTGLSPRFWSLPLGAPVRCSHHFIFATFNTNMMAIFLWVRLWLRVRGSGSPHLFLTCSGGGGGSTPCLRFRVAPSPASVAGCGACPSSDCQVQGYPCFIQICDFTFCTFCFLLLFYCVSLPKNVPWGCAIWTHDVTSDWVDLGSPFSHFQDSVSCLTCSQDSQLL